MPLYNVFPGSSMVFPNGKVLPVGHDVATRVFAYISAEIMPLVLNPADEGAERTLRNYLACAARTKQKWAKQFAEHFIWLSSLGKKEDLLEQNKFSVNLMNNMIKDYFFYQDSEWFTKFQRATKYTDRLTYMTKFFLADYDSGPAVTARKTIWDTVDKLGANALPSDNLEGALQVVQKNFFGDNAALNLLSRLSEAFGARHVNYLWRDQFNVHIDALNLVVQRNVQESLIGANIAGMKWIGLTLRGPDLAQKPPVVDAALRLFSAFGHAVQLDAIEMDYEQESVYDNLLRVRQFAIEETYEYLFSVVSQSCHNCLVPVTHYDYGVVANKFFVPGSGLTDYVGKLLSAATQGELQAFMGEVDYQNYQNVVMQRMHAFSSHTVAIVSKYCELTPSTKKIAALLQNDKYDYGYGDALRPFAKLLKSCSSVSNDLESVCRVACELNKGHAQYEDAVAHSVMIEMARIFQYRIAALIGKYSEATQVKERWSKMFSMYHTDPELMRYFYGKDAAEVFDRYLMQFSGIDPDQLTYLARSKSFGDGRRVLSPYILYQAEDYSIQVNQTSFAQVSAEGIKKQYPQFTCSAGQRFYDPKKLISAAKKPSAKIPAAKIPAATPPASQPPEKIDNSTQLTAYAAGGFLFGVFVGFTAAKMQQKGWKRASQLMQAGSVVLLAAGVYAAVEREQNTTALLTASAQLAGLFAGHRLAAAVTPARKTGKLFKKS